MVNTPISVWWCCLNPRERTMISLLIGSYFANNEYVLASTYTLYAFITGMAVSIKMDTHFKALYGLTDGTILDEEGDPVAVVFFDALTWANFYTFSQTADFTCPDPCSLLGFN